MGDLLDYGEVHFLPASMSLAAETSRCAAVTIDASEQFVTLAAMEGGGESQESASG